MHASCCFVVVAVKAPTSPAVGCTWLHVEHINNVHNTHSAVLTAHPHATATACAGHMSGPAHYSACRYCAIPPSNAVHPHTDPSRPQHLFLAGLTLQQATHHQHQHRCCSTCWWAAHTHTMQTATPLGLGCSQRTPHSNQPCQDGVSVSC